MPDAQPPLVSVVVPFYNVEKYIEQCLDSIIGQSLKEIEVICVNDATTDSSADVVRRYAAKDPRVKYLENSINSGVSVARNKGMEAATGKYIYVMDSDDFLDPDALKKMHGRAESMNADMVICDAWSYFDENNKEIYRHPHRHKRQEHWQGHAAWWFIFRRSIIMEHPDIRFPNGAHPTEDTTFSFMLFSYVEKYGYVGEPLIYYRQHENMCMKQISGKKRESYLESIFISLDRLKRYMKEHPDIARKRERAYIALVANLVSEACDHNQFNLKDFPPRIKSLVRIYRIKSFLINYKVTNSNHLLVKVCKVPVFYKKME